MFPVWLNHEWCLYVFNMERTRLTVFNLLYTQVAARVYEGKHGGTVRMMQRGLKILGTILVDDWEMDISAWTVVYNQNMHVACGMCVFPSRSFKLVRCMFHQVLTSV